VTRHRVLVVHDDPSVLQSFDRVLRVRYEVESISNGFAALRLIRSDASFAVIIAKLRMPHVDGGTLLEECRRLIPDAVRLLLCDDSSLRDAVSVANDVGVHRLLLEPCDAATQTAAVLAAIKQHELVRAEHLILEHTLRGSLEALADVFAIVQPAAFGRAVRLRRHVAELAVRVGVKGTWEVEVAALLSQLGCVALSPDTIDRWYHGRSLAPEEQEHIANLPDVAERVISHIPGLDAVRTILRRQHEPPGEGLPIGAMILAIATDFDLLIAQGVTADLALSTMEGRSDRYNAELLREFRALRGSTAPAASVREMNMLDVGVGMIFAADVTGPTGVLLIARGQRVTEHLRHNIRTHWCGLAAVLDVRMILPETDAVPVLPAIAEVA
jgi:response regulator RpfG family c-di-GMP phosphodiesterase